MKRYLAFFGHREYSEGGMEDMLSDHDTIDDAKKSIDDRMNMCEEKSWNVYWSYIWDIKLGIKLLNKSPYDKI